MSAIAGAAPHGPPESLLVEAIDHLPIAVVLLDGDGVIAHANRPFGDLVGHPADQLLGERLHDLAADPPDHVDELLRRWTASSGTRPGALEIAADGDEGTIDLRCDGARLRSHDFTMLVARERERVVRPFADLTREIETKNLREMRARLEASIEELRVANRRLVRSNEELETYAQVVSHDLRTPLATIMGFSELLLEDAADDLDEGALEALQTIRRAARRMDEVTLALLRLSRVGGDDPDPTRVDPNEVVAEVLDQIRADLADIGAEIEVEDLHDVTVEPTHLVQILQNLLTNSLKYRHPERPLRVRVRSERDDSRIRITVADNGVGVPHDESDAIFEPLGRGRRTEEVAGSGIGLSTCRKIVELYGGTIGCDPGDGGATFTFTLPAAP